MTRQLVLLVGSGLLLSAQVQTERVTATVTADSNAKSVLIVRNQATIDLTAWAFVLQASDKGAFMVAESNWHDAALEDRLPRVELAPIRPGQQKSTSAGSGMQLGTFAAIWSDGSSFGDPTLLQQLSDRKTFARSQIPNIAALLQSATAEKAPLGDLIATLQQGFAGLPNNVTTLPVREVYQLLIENLQKTLVSTNGKSVSDQEKLGLVIGQLRRRQERLAKYP